MSFDLGFNFRSTAGWVTDAAGDTYVLDTDAYPTTRGGETFGWDQGSVGSRDRTTGTDPKIAGENQQDGPTIRFRIDLNEAGTYDFRAAFGDDGSSAPAGNWVIKDGGSTLATLDGSTTTSFEFRDAAGTLYSGTNWLTSNTAISIGFSGTTFTMECDSSNVQRIAHMHLLLTAAAGGFDPATFVQPVIAQPDRSPCDILGY